MNDTSPHREPLPALSPCPTSPLSPEANTTLLVPDSDDGPELEVSLTPAQRIALECLFDGQSVSAAAKSACVSRQTVSRWIRASVDFKTVYEAWHREIQKNVKDRLAAIGDAAMDNITDAIRMHGDLRASEFVVKQLLAHKQK